MKYLSLFSGIGGFELGIQQAYETSIKSKKLQGKKLCARKDSNSTKPTLWEQPNTCIGYSEIDKYAIQIYEKHFKHKNYGDATTIIPKELPDFDLLVGGFPCQAFSIAGKRKGFDDTRGTLFFDIARVLKDKRPRHILLENVKGLLSHEQGKTFQTILGVLSDLGYSVEWQVLNSKNFGVPQNRERVFISGCLGRGCRRKIFPIGNSNETNNEPNQKLREQTSNTLQTNYGGGYSNETYVLEEKKFQRLPIKEGNKEISRTLLARDYKDPKLVLIPTNTKRGYDIAESGDSINLSVPNSKTRRGRVGKKIAQTIDTGMQQYTLKSSKIRRLTPIECERLQGFPDNWTEGLSDTQRYKTLGNGVTVNVIKAIVENYLTKS